MSLHGRNLSLLSCLILLAEDYEDALAEHVRTKKNKEEMVVLEILLILTELFVSGGIQTLL